MKKVRVIKIGGNVIDDPEKLDAFLDDFASIEDAKILIHGGGKRASSVSRGMGIVPNLIEGRRVTDAGTLEVVTMVYGGLINKNLVAKLQALNCNTLGFTGADLNMIPAHKRALKNIDYGFVGDFEVNDINSSRLSWLIEEDVVPVFCALTHDQKGSLLNTNADTMASGVASALAKTYNVELEYCFEKSGVLSNPDDDNSYLDTLSPLKMKELKEQGVISEGMIPKLKNGFEALNYGVSKVIVKSAEAINIDTGTQLIH